ncbi:EF-hand domain [Dillenia turbinata]|uniref:EF-hand domain n=1 Tax=Dillenia turbinata TaxID=194707 RepID=A0AAN8VR87_9MAGN
MPMWMPRRADFPLSDEQLKFLLKKFDANGDGKLSKQELQDAFKSMGLHFCGWRAKKAVRHADKNGDGYVNEEELNDLVR